MYIIYISYMLYMYEVYIYIPFGDDSCHPIYDP